MRVRRKDVLTRFLENPKTLGRWSAAYHKDENYLIDKGLFKVGRWLGKSFPGVGEQNRRIRGEMLKESLEKERIIKEKKEREKERNVFVRFLSELCQFILGLVILIGIIYLVRRIYG